MLLTLKSYSMKNIIRLLASLKHSFLNRDVPGRIVPDAFLVMTVTCLLLHAQAFSASAAQLRAGVAKVNITNLEPGGLVKDSVYARALVLDNGTTRVVIVSVDILIVGSFLETVRTGLHKDLNIDPQNILINASQLHTARSASPDIDKRIINAVKKAWLNMVPVTVGAGKGFEDRIMENRRLKLKNGREWTIRHANPLPPDEEVAGIGPVDPEIGILRLDRKDGRTLAVVYNFACHPYQDSRQDKKGWQELGTTADFPGYACRIIENNMSEGTIALFLQGFDGDVTTVLYKDVNNPRESEPLGNMLGLSTLQTLRTIRCKADNELKIVSETIELPRRSDIPVRLESLRTEQQELLRSLRGTSLNIKTFIPLYIKYKLSPDYPSYYSHRYMRENAIGKHDLEGLDSENRRNLDKYLSNIIAMEKLARIQENMAILNRIQADNASSGEKTMKFEIHGLRIGDFVLITFPGEALIEIALDIKNFSPHKYTFTAGHTNSVGSNFLYAPTEEQYGGEDYEDANTYLAPEWQKIYESKVREILGKL
jgi:hypothetical protein